MDFRSAFQEADTGVPFSNKSLIIAANSLLSQLKLLLEEQKLPAVDVSRSGWGKIQTTNLPCRDQIRQY